MLVQKAFFVAGNGLKDITLGAELFVLKVAPVWQSCFMGKRKADECFRPWSQKEPLMSWQVRKCWKFQPMGKLATQCPYQRYLNVSRFSNPGSFALM